MAAKRPKFWMQKVREGMEKRGTVGKFGKATSAKIAAGKKAGGKESKRAVLAETFKRFAQRKKKRAASR